MLTILIRTIVMYIVVVLALRLMGKKQLSDFEPSELVVTIMISEIAAQPIQDNAQPLISSIIVIILLLIFEVILSFIAFKSPKTRKILYGTPSVFFEKGKLNISEMERQRFSITDLMEAIRNNGNSSLSEVDYVIMETNGDISVIPSALYRPVTPRDLNLAPEEDFVSYIIIDGGKIYKDNLKNLGFDENWLMKQLKKENLNSIKDVFYFSANKNGETFLMKKE